MPSHDALPSYAPSLSALHRACGAQLRRMVDALPLAEGADVLDFPCGDGTYLPWFAQRVGCGGRVVGADRNVAYLTAARELAAESGYSERVQTQVAEAAALPFDAEAFDFVWCAHSLYSMPDPPSVLRELVRVVRRGGSIGILENDSFHHWLLPWPVPLEVAVRRAQLAALEKRSADWRKHYIGRGLFGLLADAGLVEVRVVTHSIDHAAPLPADERELVVDYLSDLRELTWAELDAKTRMDLCTFIDGGRGQRAAVDSEDFFGAHLEIVATARRP